jgi:hypothetical protein
MTVDDINYLLATDDVWLEQAIVALHHRQTDLEKLTRATYVENEVGMQIADAKHFSRFAEKIKRLRREQNRPWGECLSDVEKRYARRPWHRGKTPKPTICKYRVQVWKMVEAKKGAKCQ